MSRKQPLSKVPARPARSTVRDIMSSDPVTVFPQTSVPRIAQLMHGRGISGLPVVSETGRVVGIVTDADLVSRNTRVESPEIPDLLEEGVQVGPPAEFRRRLRPKVGAQARDVMTEEVITVGPDEDVEALATILVKNGINMVPVVEGGRIVGVVSRADVIRWMTREDWPKEKAS